MRDVLVRFLHHKGVTEEELCKEMEAYEYAAPDKVIAGEELPYMSFFPITQEVLELTEEETAELFEAARRDTLLASRVRRGEGSVS